MKVGVLTLLSRNWNTNFGALLQAYALLRQLKNLGVDSYLIDFTPSTPSLPKAAIEALKQKGIRYTLIRGLSILKKSFRQSTSLIGRQFEAKRKKKTLEFINSQFNLTRPIEKFEDLLNSNLEFDVYIAGSDIIWYPKNPNLEVYLLGFVRSGKKVSYAASVSERIPANLCPVYRKHLLTFDRLSVREKTSALYLSECLGFEPKIVVDPTLLFTKEEWEKLCKEPENLPEKPYVLVYDLYRSDEIVPRIYKIAEENGLGIICYNYKIARKYKIPSFYDFDPFEFLWLIKNSEFVITTSFHGTAFSVLFERPFYSIDPNLLSCRITDFLEMLSLDGRFVRDPASINSLSFDIDFSEAKEITKKRREDSIRFLKEALGV